MFTKMFYLLLLLLAAPAAPAAHAAKCHGLNTISGYDDICESEARTGHAENLVKNKCTYVSLTGTNCETKKKKSNICKENCNFWMKGTGSSSYKYYDNWELKVCNSETGAVASNNASFVCKDGDTRFLCKSDASDSSITGKICTNKTCAEGLIDLESQTKFYCKCKGAEGGEFDGNCNFISNEDLLVTALYIITAVAIFIKYVAECCQKEKTNQRCSQFSTFMLIVLLLVSLGFWIFAEYSATFPFAFFLSLIVLALKVGRVWYVNKQEGGNITVKKFVKAYRDDRFNVI